ncbi:replication protein RepA [Roseicella aquatilis]|uniref:Pirin n=1 Tax=Roseicella aquatilis TaxID=2527868 RepID=A0A4R4D590_9PROT|nr:replication protein RepA [Roseicella aquatilis]TCZ54571.1 pirin [Roseicella aquatilis]
MADDADQGVRHLVLVHGREQARAMVEPEKRRLVDIAAEVLGDEHGRIGITYSGFCLTGLPHKRLADDAVWTKTGHRVTLVIEPGRSDGRGGEDQPRFIGVPYGARARMILLYLQTQAIRTGNREVELGRSMRDWLGRMGLSWGGETGRTLREQAARIAACHLRFSWEGERADGWLKGGFVRSGLRFHARNSDDQQALLWEDCVVLDEVFYEALRRHPVPLRDAALRELADRSVSLDIYIWLAYRLHMLERPTPIRWAALREQFGGGAYAELRNFKREFRKALAHAVVAYPEARVEVEDEAGLILHPSLPPVAPRLMAVR